MTSPDMQVHLRDARLMFEVGMVRLAARKASDKDAEALRACLSRMEEAKGDAKRFVSEDMRFHQKIAAVSGNPICSAVSEAMLHWAFEFYPRLLRVPGTEEVTIREHSKVLNAIVAGDEELAAQEMATHLNRSNRIYGKAEREKSGTVTRHRTRAKSG